MFSAALAAFLAGSTPAEIVYFLPNVRVGGAVSHRLVACPDSNRPLPKLEYTPAIAAKAVRGRPIAFNARGGFLVDRTTKITFQDGMLKEFNATSKGQAGPLIISVLKAAAKAYTFGVGVPGVAAAAAPIPDHVLRCTSEAEQHLSYLAAAEADIKLLESRLTKGPDSEAAELLKLRREQADALKKKLSFQVATEKPLEPKRAGDGTVAGLKADLPHSAFIEGLGKLIEVVERGARRPLTQADLLRHSPGADPMPGTYGYELTVAPNGKLDHYLGCPASSASQCSELDRNPDQMIRSRDLVYVRAVPAVSALAPKWQCAAEPCERGKPNDWGDEATSKAPLTLPQLGRLSYLPTGGGSIFGGRRVAAAFDALGEPTSLEYDQGGGAADVASVIDAAAAEASTVRDAELTAMKREIDILKARKELEDLLAAQLEEE